MKFKIQILFLILIIITSSQVNARTRENSVENFIKDTRIDSTGFADTPKVAVTITSTTLALDISDLINYEVNNTLDILLNFQQSHNDDGGFGSKPDTISTWKDSVSAIQGLNYLRLNSSILYNWNIFQYLNNSVNSNLYKDVSVGNDTIKFPIDLNQDIIRIWREYIISSYLIGIIPTIPTEFLINQLKAFQFSNGTYNSFHIAVETVILLSIFNDQPDQPEFASKFIRAYAQSNGAFSTDIQGTSTINATYRAMVALQALNRLFELEYQDAIARFILNQQLQNSGFKEVNSDEVTIQDTWIALTSLLILNRLDELKSPDVLQTHGFISIDIFWIVIPINIIIFRRRKT